MTENYELNFKHLENKKEEVKLMPSKIKLYSDYSCDLCKIKDFKDEFIDISSPKFVPLAKDNFSEEKKDYCLEVLSLNALCHKCYFKYCCNN